MEEGHFLLPVREEESSSASQDATIRVRRSRALDGSRLGRTHRSKRETWMGGRRFCRAEERVMCGCNMVVGTVEGWS